MSFTLGELEAAFEAEAVEWLDDPTYDLYIGEFWSEFDYHKQAYITGIGVATFIESGKMYSEQYQFDTYVVFEVAGRFFRKKGYYMSYEGSSWDGALEEVKEVPVTGTEWKVVE